MAHNDNIFIHDEKAFGLRLAKLRACKNVSAREMSLALGQNKNYINAIEAGRNLPSMSSFFCICDYLGITPKDFFNIDYKNPLPTKPFENIFRKLTPDQAEHIYQIALDITTKN